MANIVAQAENAFVAVVGGIIRGVAHMEVRVVGNGVPQGAEILVVAEDGDAGFGVTEHRLIFLVQEIHSTCEDLQPVVELIADTRLEVDVVAGDCTFTGGQIQVTDHHGAEIGTETSGSPVDARISLVYRGSGIEHIHLQETVIGIEAECTVDAPVGGKLDTLVGEGTDIAVLRLTVLTHHLDDVGSLGIEEAEFGIESSAQEMLSESQVIAPGLFREEFGIGGCVHVELTHVGHAETLRG